MSREISTSPARNFEVITPSDSTDLTVIYRSLYIGSDGNIDVTREDGTVVPYPGLKSGSILPVSPTRVMATNTTVSPINGLL